MKTKLILILLLPSVELFVCQLHKLLLLSKLFRPKLHRRHLLHPVLQPLPKQNPVTMITLLPNLKHRKNHPALKLMNLLPPKLVPKLILLSRRIILPHNLMSPMAAVMMMKKMILIQQIKLIPKKKMSWPT